MRIALVAQDIHRETFFKEMAVPLGLCYLAAYVEKYLPEGIEFKIFKGDERFTISHFDCVGISAMSYNFPRACALARSIKQEGSIPVIIGGPHITAFPHKLPEAFDVGVLGEGEETFLDILRLLKREGTLPGDALKNMKGISYHEAGSVIVNPRRPPIKLMESIPIPRRDLFDMEGRLKQVFSGRGCPFKCRFCGLQDWRYRKFPIDHIISELLNMKEHYDLGAILFQDEAFSLDRKWLKEFVSALKREKQLDGMAYFISMRADHIDEETADLLCEMNVRLIFIGIESGSEKILQYLKNGTITVGQVQNALDLCAERDIQVEGSFIIGSPEESPEDLEMTYDFICENFSAGKIDLANIFALIPYPGSALWEEAEKRGLVGEDMDWNRLISFSILEFDPRRYIYLNKVMPIEEFCGYVGVFQDLMATIYKKRIKNLRKSVFDPMGVKDFYGGAQDQ